MTRLRVRYTKLGKIRFIGHRDLARVWERALRRSGLPIASTEGFSPRPKMHFGLALSTGFESLGEYLDVDLIDSTDAPQPSYAEEVLIARFAPLLPAGVAVQAVAVIERGKSLQAAVTACSWVIDLDGVAPTAVGGAVDRFLAADAVILERVRDDQVVEVDVRACVAELELIGACGLPGWESGTSIRLDLGTASPGLKVMELIGLLAPEATAHRVCRTHQWIEGAGSRQEPLAVTTASALAERQAS